jgi:hypothetical protein
MCNHRFKYLKEAMNHTEPGIYKEYRHNVAIVLGHVIAESDAEKQK